MLDIKNIGWIYYVQISEDEKVIISDEDFSKIKEWCEFDWEKVIETEEYIETNKSTRITAINSAFDKKVSDFLLKYPQREQDTFAQKVVEAKKVLSGEASIYISWKATALGVTAEEFANKIIEKSNYFMQLYTDLENEKDLKVQEILSEPIPEVNE